MIIYVLIVVIFAIIFFISSGYEYALSTKGIDPNGVPYIDERFTLANSH